MIQALLTMGKLFIEGFKLAYKERMLAVRNLVQAGPKQVGLILLLLLLWLHGIARFLSAGGKISIEFLRMRGQIDVLNCPA